ncbi:Hypothetical protein FKW44_020842 [Caligus rogercresseyi]|uniref:Uncharacterized protein n=1 Tax=Caligus rogercresseyi TaxID=217165 RepID=A0A7T8GR10_CALRO|nr:Hypothetical protein FKW44_020842 [Caligus rogercresseyi]
MMSRRQTDRHYLSLSLRLVGWLIPSAQKMTCRAPRREEWTPVRERERVIAFVLSPY